MRLRNITIILATLALLLLTAVGCSEKQSESEVINFPELNLKSIVYEIPDIKYEETNNVRLSGSPSHNTGEYIDLSVNVREIRGDFVYYIFDWGDGSWSYNGPFSSGVAGSIRHIYNEPGTYEVRAKAVDLRNGQSPGWSRPLQVTVEGGNINRGYINKITAISSSYYGEGYEAERILDNDNTTSWKSEITDDIKGEEWVGLLFESHYKLDTLEIKTPENATIWPQNFAIEYTTDGGEVWHSLPKYYYLYDYQNGRYSPFMGFPNPKGATFVLRTDGIVANGIRINTKLFPIEDLSEDKYFTISEMRVTGDNRPLFYTSKGGSYDANINNMYTIYGSAKTEPKVRGILAGPNPDPFRSGSTMITSTEWHHWDGLKHIWTSYDEAIEYYNRFFFDAYVGDDGRGNDGFVWATHKGQIHLDMQQHYTYNSILIIAARNYILQGNNINLNQFMGIKNWNGDTMESRLERAMKYMLEVMKGKDGLLIITDSKHDGTTKGHASNYWDVHRAFGYKSTYENILFYASLLSMSDIETLRGDNESAEYYVSLAAQVRENFNNYFWDDEKGRYITSININGERLDWGITFVNFMAAAYGLATPDRAEKIYEWLDGKRIIEGDTSKGEDIYGRFKYAARSTTLDVSTVGPPYYWYDHKGMLPPTPGSFGGFGNNMQNGGTIFYISYYDILGRIKHLGPDNALLRFNTIINEFKKDELRRFGYSQHGGYIEGVIGEFPESGLVPLTFLYGFMGVRTETNGLVINAQLPKDWSYAGVREYIYNDRVYSIKVDRNIKKPVAEKHGGIWFVQLPDDEVWLITPDNKLMKR